MNSHMTTPNRNTHDSTPNKPSHIYNIIINKPTQYHPLHSCSVSYHKTQSPSLSQQPTKTNTSPFPTTLPTPSSPLPLPQISKSPSTLHESTPHIPPDNKLVRLKPLSMQQVRYRFALSLFLRPVFRESVMARMRVRFAKKKIGSKEQWNSVFHPHYEVSLKQASRDHGSLPPVTLMEFSVSMARL